MIKQSAVQFHYLLNWTTEYHSMPGSKQRYGDLRLTSTATRYCPLLGSWWISSYLLKKQVWNISSAKFGQLIKSFISKLSADKFRTLE